MVSTRASDRVALGPARGAHGPAHAIPGDQLAAADLRGGDVDVRSEGSGGETRRKAEPLPSSSTTP